ncbi:NYN domain-containing protein [Alteromonas sp. BL110]|uniref:NYN domain-containing protein n=1 Tax=unclassified Alteromonas TaxID=2614992 RepID=UPI00044CD8CE|nr:MULTISPECIES: NYN domain-containing protein [unclassified Alteromonas]AXT40458.1 NYN domain-containing protein [Alteromonas sp. BL110]MBT3134803.1 NYN domain-containing protein [Alteromonas sp. ALT199]RKM79691.1 NYN domain-containing protein [Alteromonas sp. BL110]
MSENGNDKLAVLIDADNAQAAICSELLAEVSKFGVANVKRAYGDWTTVSLKGWKSYLHKHAIQPIQQFSYTQGKNSTDSSLIIDAMDLLHEGKLDGFCLISSDSDFTRLASRIRESGLLVYGFGERKTPEAFVAACDKFVYTEVLKSSTKQTVKDESKNVDLKTIVVDAVNAVSRDNDWAPLSGVGGYIIKNTPSFDPRNYGYDKLGQLVKSLAYLEFEERRFSDGSSNVHIYVREKVA